MSTAPPDSILYFDGTCGFCSSVVRNVGRLDLKCSFVALQTADLQSLGIDPAIAHFKVPFRSSTGDVSYGHEAVANALRTGSVLWSAVGRVMLIQPFATLASVIYAFVAKHRHEFPGGTPACALDGTPHSKA